MGKLAKKTFIVLCCAFTLLLFTVFGVACNESRNSSAELEELNYGSSRVSFAVLGKSNSGQSYSQYETTFEIEIRNDCAVDITYLECDMIVTALDSGEELCSGSVWFNGNIVKGAQNKFDLTLKTTDNALWNYSLQGLKIQCKITSAIFKDSVEKEYSTSYVTIYDGSMLNEVDGEGLSMMLSADGSYYIVTGVRDRSKTAYTIPSSYDGKPVLAIGNSAFEACDMLTDLVLPSRIETIGDFAFLGCSALKSITIPSSVTVMGSCVFSYCYDITIFCQTISMPNGWSSDWDVIAYNDRHTPIWNYAGVQGVTFDGLVWYGLNDGNAQIVDFENTTAVRLAVPSNIQGYAVKEIPDGLFEGCAQLATVELSNGIERIGESAFYGCTALTNITLPASLKSIGDNAFEGCALLADIALPSGVEAIGSYAFYGCTALTDVSIPSTALNVGSFAFADCEDLTIYCEAETKPDGWADSWNAVEYDYWASNWKCFPVVWNYAGAQGETQDGVLWYALQNGTVVVSGIKDTSRRSMTVPLAIEGRAVSEIKQGVFSDCRALTSITLPFVGADIRGEENTHFGYVFGADSYQNNADCVPSALREVKVLGGESIGKNAFYGCAYLTEIEIADSVKAVGDDAFKNCHNLSYTVKDGLKYLGSGNNPYMYLCETTTIDIETATIESGCRFVGTGAFSDCSLLISLTIPESVTSIASNAFTACRRLYDLYYNGNVATWCAIRFTEYDSNPMTYTTNVYFQNQPLTTIDIPSTVTEVGNYAFYSCPGITSISLPESLTRVGDYAFYYCAEVESITIPARVTYIGKGAFKGCADLVQAVFVNPNGWSYYYREGATGTALASREIATPTQAATYLRATYCDYYWKR